ncbi:hypothetical protein HDV00_005166 [Rhizophlyctis rosea]|nr:hypothetical protein HDV00_005166 [Rhizophlyctis rosea]
MLAGQTSEPKKPAETLGRQDSWQLGEYEVVVSGLINIESNCTSETRLAAGIQVTPFIAISHTWPSSECTLLPTNSTDVPAAKTLTQSTLPTTDLATSNQTVDGILQNCSPWCSAIYEKAKEAVAAYNLQRGASLEHVWIDFLCVDQTNPAAIAEATNTMGYVYHCAVATVVMTKGETCIDDLRWYGRRWTLQEARLAKELWFFDGVTLRNEGSMEVRHQSRWDRIRQTTAWRAADAFQESAAREGGWGLDDIFCVRTLVPGLLELRITYNKPRAAILHEVYARLAAAGDYSWVSDGPRSSEVGLNATPRTFGEEKLGYPKAEENVYLEWGRLSPTDYIRKYFKKMSTQYGKSYAWLSWLDLRTRLLPVEKYLRKLVAQHNPESIKHVVNLLSLIAQTYGDRPQHQARIILCGSFYVLVLPDAIPTDICVGCVSDPARIMQDGIKVVPLYVVDGQLKIARWTSVCSVLPKHILAAVPVFYTDTIDGPRFASAWVVG